MARLLTRSILATACLAVASGAQAERSLYGKQPGQDAIFVRFVNALDAEASVTSDLLPPQTLGAGDEDRVGRYLAVERADARTLVLVVRAGGAETRSTVPLSPGSKVSVVLRPESGALKAVALSARYEPNQTRTLLAFYNAAPECGAASLKLAPSNAVIFPDVSVDSERSRGVNPVSAQFGAACGGGSTAAAKPLRLEAGSAYSAWLLTLKGQPALVFGTDTLPSWNP